MLNLSTLEALENILSKGSYPNRNGQLYCPSCGDYRRMEVWHLSLSSRSRDTPPFLFEYTCVQCGARFTSLIYKTAEGEGLVVLPSSRGGLTTPHTPEGVSYYLDQASKSQSTGANSAAITMFRGALEHLLYEQGYVKGMLTSKIKQLEDDISGQSAPKWAMELDTEFLNIIKQLGNGAIHPNDGDISKQAVIDNDLIELVKETFHMLLYLVYELPTIKESRLDKLREKSKILSK